MVLSPCIKTCKIDADRRVCIDCWRTLDDIVAWLDLKDDERRAVIARAEERRRAFEGVDAPRRPA